MDYKIETDAECIVNQQFEITGLSNKLVKLEKEIKLSREINRTLANANADYKQENKKLKQFQEEVRMCIPHIDEKISGYEKLRKCVEFYAENKNRNVSDLERFDYNSYYPDRAYYKEGKLARQTLKELNPKINNSEEKEENESISSRT